MGNEQRPKNEVKNGGGAGRPKEAAAPEAATDPAGPNGGSGEQKARPFWPGDPNRKPWPPARTVLKVDQFAGPTEDGYQEANPVVYRVLAVRGDCSLRDLHRAIGAAFDRAKVKQMKCSFARMKVAGDDAILSRILDDAEGRGLASSFDRSEELELIALDELRLHAGARFWCRSETFESREPWSYLVTVLSTEPAPAGCPRHEILDRVGDAPNEGPVGQPGWREPFAGGEWNAKNTGQS